MSRIPAAWTHTPTPPTPFTPATGTPTRSYLKDVKLGQGLTLAQALAAQLGPQLHGGGFRSSDLDTLLKKVRAPTGPPRPPLGLPACLLWPCAGGSARRSAGPVTLRLAVRGSPSLLPLQVPIRLGGGKLTAALGDLLPAGCVRDFERLLEDYARDL